ncbi:murein hydrolase activator EnvC family protein [Knoellia subterranea]|uniref:Peptidase M23 n=1 Tax=Knoellia subterranea KCTC 19937 TaxID=1385521 RepID=A0A0A0JM86_9MICO|nr:peptidoglycan DD-metalloendopeptidase family protein [Knoellia subterranea]KGN36756.1 peptidase M23 [Knoellia subterranea KCTC 19937]
MTTPRTMATLGQLLLALAAAGSLVPGVGLPAGPGVTPDISPTTVPGALAPTASAGATADPTTLRGTWSWPLSPRPTVLARFVRPRETWGAGHRGIDLSASQGQEVRSVDAGTVTHVGVIAGRGTVSVTHASGLRSTYEPVDANVSSGDVVVEGQPIGRVLGRTHCGGACLHLGALDGEAYLDPRPLLGGTRVILLPLEADR